MKLFRNDRKTDKKAGGIAVLISDDLIVNEVTEVDTDNEMQTIMIKIDDLKLIIVNSYLPPLATTDYNNSMKHLEQINNYLEQDPDYNINLCGDYNSRNILAYERDEEGEVIANIVNHQDEVMDLTFTKKDDITGIKASRIFFAKLLAVTDRHGLFPKLDKNTR